MNKGVDQSIMKRRAKLTRTIGDYNLPLALCSFFLQNGEWKPCGMGAKLTDRHRSAEDGPIITAQVTAAVDRQCVVAWTKPAYLRRSVSEHGTIEPADLTRVANALYAKVRDDEASRAGAIGINQKLLDHKPDPQSWTPTPELRGKLFQLARTLIEQKIRGRRVTGVRLYDGHVS